MDDTTLEALKLTIQQLSGDVGNLIFQRNIAQRQAAAAQAQVAELAAKVETLNKALETEKSLRESAIAPI